MVATMKVYRDYGGADNAPGASVDITNYGPPMVRFKLADDPGIDQDDELILPAAGNGPYYSFWANHYLYCADADGSTINAVKFYSDGANGYGTGVNVYVGDETPTKNSGSDAGYEVAVVDPAEPNSGLELSAGHADITGVTDVFSYTAGASALSVSISEAGNVIDDAGESADYVFWQASVASTASAGQTSTETFYYSYTEA